eukprot:g3017.t1
MSTNYGWFRSIAVRGGGFAALTVLCLVWRKRMRDERKRTSKKIPLIDISSVLGASRGNKNVVAKELAREFDRTFRDVGFCLIVGFEKVLSRETINTVRKESEAFFRLSAKEKEKAAADDGFAGYRAVGAENVGASAGKPTEHPDPVESMNLSGYQENEGWTLKEAVEGKAPWRRAAYVRGMPASLRKACADYAAGVTSIMSALMLITESALDLPRGFFDSCFERPGTTLRLAYYPAVSKVSVEDAVGATRYRYGRHTDYDAFTILQRCSDDSGLEILMKDGTWQSVVAPPDSLTINIGDLLARWTNDRWIATPHRVVMPKDRSKSRLSVVYFTGPHPNTT